MLGSWVLVGSCSDPLANDCERTLRCGDQAGYYLDSDCVWRHADGTRWQDGPYRDPADGVWKWPGNNEPTATQDFVCGAGPGPIVPDDAGSDDSELGGGGGPLPTDAGPDEPTPPDPNCNTNGVPCGPNLTCNEAGNCVGCVDDTSCGMGAPYCRQDDATCVPCLNDSHCNFPGFARCDLETNTCQPCTESAQCEGIENAPLCDGNGRCVQCLDGEQCPEATPQCKPSTSSCVQCLDDEHCTERNLSDCDEATNSCVPCTNSDQCEDDFPLCRNDGRCVQCINGIQCLSPTASQCNGAGDCVPCENNAQCAHIPGRAVCNTALNPSTCVQCVTDDDCDSDTASRCVNNQCVACENNADCAGQPSGNTVCDTAPNPNRCVQCTGTDFAACAVAGSARVCDSVNKRCTNLAPGSAGLCGECVSDAQCATGNLCVPQALGTTSTPYCFPQAATQGAPCQGLGAFRAPSPSGTNSLDRQNVTVCTLATTTCAARADMLAGETCASNTDCGAPNVDDGICAPTPSGNLCTVVCASSLDCGTARTCLDGEPQICSD